MHNVKKFFVLVVSCLTISSASGVGPLCKVLDDPSDRSRFLDVISSAIESDASHDFNESIVTDLISAGDAACYSKKMFGFKIAGLVGTGLGCIKLAASTFVRCCFVRDADRNAANNIMGALDDVVRGRLRCWGNLLSFTNVLFPTVGLVVECLSLKNSWELSAVADFVPLVTFVWQCVSDVALFAYWNHVADNVAPPVPAANQNVRMRITNAVGRLWSRYKQRLSL
jgi:hypothetical protein